MFDVLNEKCFSIFFGIDKLNYGDCSFWDSFMYKDIMEINLVGGIILNGFIL